MPDVKKYAFVLEVSCMKKKILVLGLLGALIGTSLSYTGPVYAAKQDVRSSTSTQTAVSSPKQSADYSYLKKHTGFSKKEIKNLLSQGLKKEDIKRLYILKTMSTEKFKDVLTIYKESDNIEMALKDLKIEKSKFWAAYEKQYPEDEQTNHDRAAKIHRQMHGQSIS